MTFMTWFTIHRLTAEPLRPWHWRLVVTRTTCDCTPTVMTFLHGHLSPFTAQLWQHDHYVLGVVQRLTLRSTCRRGGAVLQLPCAGRPELAQSLACSLSQIDYCNAKRPSTSCSNQTTLKPQRVQNKAARVVGLLQAPRWDHATQPFNLTGSINE